MLNDIKSKMVLNIIFGILKKFRKLKILKYSKIIRERLNITLKDFKKCFLIKKMNQKFKLDIDDYDIEIFDFKSNQSFGNKIFEYLNKIGFNKLKDLDLSDNKISDISLLAKSNFEQLEILWLNYNRIYDINILGKVNFKKLKILDLYHNNIY